MQSGLGLTFANAHTRVWGQKRLPAASSLLFSGSSGGRYWVLSLIRLAGLVCLPHAPGSAFSLTSFRKNLSRTTGSKRRIMKKKENRHLGYNSQEYLFSRHWSFFFLVMFPLSSFQKSLVLKADFSCQRLSKFSEPPGSALGATTPKPDPIYSVCIRSNARKVSIESWVGID